MANIVQLDQSEKVFFSFTQFGFQLRLRYHTLRWLRRFLANRFLILLTSEEGSNVAQIISYAALCINILEHKTTVLQDT